MKSFLAALSLIVAGIVLQSSANVYYVATGNVNASDNGAGSLTQPYKTISKAATVLQPGDTCYIRSGIYRETVRPARGGTSESARIVYKAYPGEKPSIRGSESVTGWLKQTGNIYTVDVPNTVFGSYNPFAVNINDPSGWLWYGGNYHCGDIYIDGVSYREKFTTGEVAAASGSFFAQVGTSNTTITINYAGALTPASSLIEVNARANVFFPAASTCNYITLDGLEFAHSACNWVPCCALQTAMVDVNAGAYWIVQNCHFMDARTVALCSGQGASATSAGFQVVRNNIIERCGQAGLIGNKGWYASLVEGNLIQDINWKGEFGGAETAGMKTHHCVDLIIKNNIFRRVAFPTDQHTAWQYAIWLDYECQNVRITGNVFYEIDVGQQGNILTESSHGPFLIDNNVFIQRTPSLVGLKTSSDNMIVIHNLFVGANDGHYTDSRAVRCWTPHTLNYTGTAAAPAMVNDKYYNNLFIGGSNNIPQNSGYVTNYNAYCANATKTNWGDANSVVDASYQPGFSYQSFANGITMTFSMNANLLGVACPLVTNSLIGQLTPVNQGIEEHNGTPITINKDIFGNSRSTTKPTVGPFENLVAGNNTFTISVGVDQTQPYVALAPVSLSITADSGSMPIPVTVDVKNMSSGTLDAVTTRVAYTSGSNWLSVQKSGTGNSQTLSVQVSTAGLLMGTYNAVIIAAAANAANDSAVCPVALFITRQGTVAVNAGGPTVGYFTSDQDFSGGNTYSNSATITTAGVVNSAPATVYQTERYGNFNYTVPGLQANSQYTVRLHFAELYWDSTGKRTFNVDVNGTRALTQYDVFNQAGGKFKALVRDIAATANNQGQIVVAFTTVLDNAKVSAIEIVPSLSTVRHAPNGARMLSGKAPIQLAVNQKGDLCIAVGIDGKHSVAIYNVAGALVHQLSGIHQETYRFSRSKMGAGTYLVVGEINNVRMVNRIVW